MKQIVENLTALLKVKTIIFLVCIAVFAYLAIKGVYQLQYNGSTAVSGSDTIISGATYTIINWGG